MSLTHRTPQGERAGPCRSGRAEGAPFPFALPRKAPALLLLRPSQNRIFAELKSAWVGDEARLGEDVEIVATAGSPDGSLVPSLCRTAARSSALIRPLASTAAERQTPVAVDATRSTATAFDQFGQTMSTRP